MQVLHCNLKPLIQKLNSLGSRLPSDGSRKAQLESFSSVWNWKLHIVSLTLARVIPLTPSSSHYKSSSRHSRLPRGLINPVGTLEKWLFGVATEDDIEKLAYQVSLLSDEQMEANRVLVEQGSILREHNRHISLLVEC